MSPSVGDGGGGIDDADCNTNGDGVGLLGWDVSLGLGLSRLSHYYFCCRAEYLKQDFLG